MSPRSRPPRQVMRIGSARTAGGVQELLHRSWDLVVLSEAPAKLVGDIHGHVARPTFCGIEGDNAPRKAVLVLHKVADQRLAVGAFFVGLPPGAPESRAKV